MKFILIISFLLFFIKVDGQDTLLLMDGREYSGISIDTTLQPFQFRVNKKEGKFKIKEFYPDQIFSINYANSSEVTYYQIDQNIINDYTIENMKTLVIGRRDARYNFKTKWVFPLGIALTGVSGYLMEGNIFVILLPIIYTGLVQIPIVKIQDKSISSRSFIGDEFYIEGYNRSARSKRTKHALLSGLIGTVAGVFLYQAIN